MQDDIDSLNISTISLAYYLYRVAGTPFGDNASGLTAWLDVQKDVWREMVKPNTEDED